jgi:hypothetical protein
MSVCLSIICSVHLHSPIYLFIYVSVYLSIRSSIDLSVPPSIYVALELNAAQGHPFPGLSLLRSLSAGIITLLVDI